MHYDKLLEAPFKNSETSMFTEFFELYIKTNLKFKILNMYFSTGLTSH